MSPWPIERRQTPTVEESLALVALQVDVLKEKLSEANSTNKELFKVITELRQEMIEIKSKQIDFSEQLTKYEQSVKDLLEVYNTVVSVRKVFVWLGTSLATVVIVVSNWVTIKEYLKNIFK